MNLLTQPAVTFANKRMEDAFHLLRQSLDCSDDERRVLRQINHVRDLLARRFADGNPVPPDSTPRFLRRFSHGLCMIDIEGKWRVYYQRSSARHVRILSLVLTD